jgi:ribosomal peptide maturation radical SAM protein 1
VVDFKEKKAFAMTTGISEVTGKVLLVSAPWPLFNRPSLPIGALKAYLAGALPNLAVEACHLFLPLARALGYASYQQVSRRVWRAEAVFAALLYPDRAEQAKTLYGSTRRRGSGALPDFQSVVDRVDAFTQRWLADTDWQALTLVGFSISFCQVTASLHLISRIKARCPDLPVVVGGSSFCGAQSAALLSVFPQIDFLVVGEGERPLVELIRWLSAGSPPDGTVLPDGVLGRAVEPVGRPRMSQLDHLDDLPMPDYDDYFDALAGFSHQARFFATIPIEASRGCWWRRPSANGRFRGCAFCNLNLQWQGYRTKTPERVVAEVDRQVQRHQVLSLSFADNAFPVRHAGAIFDGLRALGRDLSLFAELRATTAPPLLARMRRAGLDTVQVGIESLSSRLLDKMNKGVRAIDNLFLMKQCEALGIVNASNLLLHFPGSDTADVDETLQALEFAGWYRPLKTVRFWLGLESPVYRHPRQFQIRSVCTHPHLKRLFPAPVADRMRFMIQSYRGDRRRQQRLWRPVERAVRDWQRTYTALQQRTSGKPALSYRDGGRFLIIDQVPPDGPAGRHRLTGASADIYRFCHSPQSIEAISTAFPAHDARQTLAYLHSLVAKRLMFAEKEAFLSLAVPASRPA